MSFFKRDSSGRLGKLSRQQSKEIVSSPKSLLDSALPLATVQHPLSPFLSSTNHTSTYSCSTLTTGTSSKRYVPLKDSTPSCSRVYLSTPLSNSYINRYEQPQSAACQTNSHPCQSNLTTSKYNSEVPKSHLDPSGGLTSFQGFANCNILLNSVPTFSQESPELWFKVLEASFEEQKIFKEITRFRCTLIKLKPSHLEVVAELLRVDHPQPYTEMKKLLIQNFGASDQERYVAVTRMKLGNDKPSELLRKMKSSFYGKPLDGVLIELLRSLFLQALPSEIRLYLIGDDISLDDIAQKADAIYAELKYNSQSTCASDTKSPKLQFYETVPDQESNLYSCDVGNSTASYGNVRKPNDSTYHPNNTYYRRQPDNHYSRNSDCSPFNPNDVPEMCWYHYKYGPVKARKCHGKPCPMFPCLNNSKNV